MSFRGPTQSQPRTTPTKAVEAVVHTRGDAPARDIEANEQTRPLKVLLMSLYHPEIVRGGAQQVCYDLFCALKDIDGVKPTLLAAIDPTLTQFYKPGAVITGFDGRENEYLFLSQGYDYKWHKLGDPRLLEHMAEFLRLINPDVVHFHHFLLFGIDAISLVRRVLPNAKIIFTFHEFMAVCHADGHLHRPLDNTNCEQPGTVRCSQCFPRLPQSYFFLRERWFKHHLNVVDLYTTPSQFMISHFIKFGLPEYKLTIIPNAIPQHEFRPQPNPRPASRTTTFAFFGQLVDIKGVALLLDAIEILYNAGIRDFGLEINGDNARFASEGLRLRLQHARANECSDGGLGKHAKFNGSYTRKTISQRMNHIDWCVIPSLWSETYCLVLSEAWAHGIPAIVPNHGAFVERVINGQGGLYFEGGVVQSLADTMAACMANSALRDQAALRIPEQPQIHDMARGYLKSYTGYAKHRAVPEQPQRDPA